MNVLLRLCLVAATAFALHVHAKNGIVEKAFPSGELFIGCNYWAKNAGMYMWRDWRADIVEKELSILANQKVQVLRIFPLWSDFQPLTGIYTWNGENRGFLQNDGALENPAAVDDRMMARFREFCDIADRHGLRLVVGLLTGWMSGRQFMPTALCGRNPLRDPESIMWQTRFVRYFVRKMADHPAIIAWNYGNECNCMGEASQAEFYNWMSLIGGAIRQSDPSRPVVSGMNSLSTHDRHRCPIRLNGELSDVLCTHPYWQYMQGCGQDAFNTMRTELLPASESLLYSGLGGKPCYIEEVGNNGTSCASESSTAAGMRCILYNAWVNDLRGCLWWCNADQESLLFPPYTEYAGERELGFLRDDGEPKPVLREMCEFRRFCESLPFQKLPPRHVDAVVVVPEKSDAWIPAFGASLLACQAGISVRFAGAERALPDSPLYIVCSAETDRCYTLPAQTRIFEKARQGATVLILYSAASRFTGFRKYTGLEISACMRKKTKRTFSFLSNPDRRMVCADEGTCSLVAHECTVLAKDGNGEPVVSEFNLGKGKVLVCNAPIDRQAVKRTDTLTGECIQPYYLVLREAMKRSPGYLRVVEKGDCPWVGLSLHPMPSGETVVVAINYEPRDMECPIGISGELCSVWRGEVSSKRIKLGANEIAVFKVKRKAE